MTFRLALCVNSHAGNPWRIQGKAGLYKCIICRRVSSTCIVANAFVCTLCVTVIVDISEYNSALSTCMYHTEYSYVPTLLWPREKTLRPPMARSGTAGGRGK